MFLVKFCWHSYPKIWTFESLVIFILSLSWKSLLSFPKYFLSDWIRKLFSKFSHIFLICNSPDSIPYIYKFLSEVAPVFPFLSEYWLSSLTEVTDPPIHLNYFAKYFAETWMHAKWISDKWHCFEQTLSFILMVKEATLWFQSWPSQWFLCWPVLGILYWNLCFPECTNLRKVLMIQEFVLMKCFWGEKIKCQCIWLGCWNQLYDSITWKPFPQWIKILKCWSYHWSK